MSMGVLLQVVETLLDYGARADMCDDLGRSPLKYAAGQGDAGSVDLLLRSLTCDSSWPPLSLVDAVRRVGLREMCTWLILIVRKALSIPKRVEGCAHMSM